MFSYLGSFNFIQRKCIGVWKEKISQFENSKLGKFKTFFFLTKKDPDVIDYASELVIYFLHFFREEGKLYELRANCEIKIQQGKNHN